MRGNIPRRTMGAAAALALIAACFSRDARDTPGDSTTAAAHVTWDAARIDTLTRFGHDDQQGRDGLARAAANRDTATLMAFMRADTARTRWLRGVAARAGWPTRTAVGDSAANAAWLILQHSPDTAWQAAMLPDLETLGRTGELPMSGVAMLGDRIRAHRGQPQRYGSQFDVVDGRLVPSPIEDIPTLDARRASIGLPPMTEYVRMLQELYKMPVVWPPK